MRSRICRDEHRVLLPTGASPTPAIDRLDEILGGSAQHQVVLAESGLDMTRFPAAAYLVPHQATFARSTMRRSRSS